MTTLPRRISRATAAPLSLVLGLAAALFAGPLRADEPVPAAVAALAELPPGLYAVIETPRGEITCELFFEQAPMACANFAGLAEGKLGAALRQPFYDGLTFHRVVPGFVVQGGDPMGNGDGVPGYTWPDEFVPGLRHDAAGVLSMANSGQDTNGSQFFLTLAEVNRLNYLHTVFGRVVRGSEFLPRIEKGDTLTRVTILRRGEAAAAFRTDEAAFRALVAAAESRPRPAELRAPAFADPRGALPSPALAEMFDRKLRNFEEATGVRVVARSFPRFEAYDFVLQPDDAARELARLTQADRNGVAVCHFPLDDFWAIAIGDQAAARLKSPAGVGPVDLEQWTTELRALGNSFSAKQDLKGGWNAVLEAILQAVERP